MKKSRKHETQNVIMILHNFLFCLQMSRKNLLKESLNTLRLNSPMNRLNLALMGDHGLIRTPNYRVGSINHQFYTIETNKIALTIFRDKRYYIDLIH